MLKNLTLLFSILLLTGCNLFDKPYDESADARAQVYAALSEARDKNKLVLLEFGANWCGDCVSLYKRMKSSPLKNIVSDNFVHVKIDIGERDKNLELANRYKAMIDNGIPTIVVIDQNEQILMGTSEGQLGKARKMGDQELVKFFNEVVLHTQKLAQISKEG